MLSYRHQYHAGNHADVLKHTLLCRALTYLTGKNRPLLFLDTHAGAGLYHLESAEARRTGEYLQGIAALWSEPDPPPLLQPYLDAVRTINPGGRLRHYPGSPALARALLRPGDRASLYELHPADHAALSADLSQDRRFRVLRANGLAGLRAQLPPRERRGLVLLDPSYERASEYRDLPAALGQALGRFATGVYLLWYPLLADAPVGRMLRDIAAGNPPSTLRVELSVAPARRGPGLTGSGLLVINPPWRMDEELGTALPWLAERLGGGSGSWRLEVTEGCGPPPGAPG
jgi:23S rRNA (adenine2030-N6)-methyltransferase